MGNVEGARGEIGNLIIGRFSGQGIYIGRDIRLTVMNLAANGITVHVEGPQGLVVTDCDLGLATHLEKVGAEERTFGTGNRNLPRVGRDYLVLLHTGLYIGRGVSVTLVELSVEGRRGPKAQIAVGAPAWMAVSRDDFTLEEHLEYQRDRERRR